LPVPDHALHEYAIDVAAACRERSIKTVAVTAGEVCPEPRGEFYRYMDAANIDLKAFSDEFYKNICAANLGPVLDTLVYLKHQTKVWIEITALLIPGLNDSSAELEKLSTWVVDKLGPDVPLHFSAFHPDYRMLDRPPTPPETLRKAREIAINNGVWHAYIGNVHDPACDSTYCHHCGQLLIGRDWYQLTKWKLVSGQKCSNCQTSLPGRMEATPGDWGPRREPVRLSHYQ